MTDMPPRSFAPGFAFLAVVAIAAVLAAFIRRQHVFVDEGGALTAILQPMARNACEEVFAHQLFSGWSPDAVPSPTEAQVRSVLDACTADELLAADQRFIFAIGPPMGYLANRRLFNGADIQDQFAALCDASAFKSSKACQAGVQ